MAKFLKNTLNNDLYLREGRVCLKPGQTIPDNEDPREFSVEWAVSREWLVEVNSASKGADTGKVPEVEIAVPLQGMTEAEMKAEKAAEEAAAAQALAEAAAKGPSEEGKLGRKNAKAATVTE